MALGPHDAEHTSQANPLNKCVHHADTYSKEAVFTPILSDQHSKTLEYGNSGALPLHVMQTIQMEVNSPLS